MKRKLLSRKIFVGIPSMFIGILVAFAITQIEDMEQAFGLSSTVLFSAGVVASVKEEDLKTTDKIADKLNKAFQDFNDLLGKKADSKDFMELSKTVEDIHTSITSKDDKEGVLAKIGQLQSSIEEHGIMLQQMKEGEQRQVKTIGEMLEEKSKDLASIPDQRGKSIRFELDWKTLVQTTAITNSTIAMRLPDVGQLAYNAGKMEGLFRKGKVGKGQGGIIRYIDQTAATRNAAFTAEAGQKPESAITWQEYTRPIEVIADTIPVTRQAFEDIAWMQSEIDRLLNTNIRVNLNTALVTGDGVTPNIFGILASAPNYTAAGAGITLPNISDLIAFMRSAIASGNSKYNPNYVILNPAEVLDVKLTKLATGEYVRPPFASPDLTSIDGCSVVEEAAMTANHLVVGDFNYAWFYTMGGIIVEVGWVNDDFLKNKMTIRAEMRCATLIRNADADGFLESTDVDADVTTIGT